jgi:capsular exopolysaccharide synthesis family protein
VSSSFLNEEIAQEPKGFTIDFKRVLSRAIRFWYVMVLSLTAALAVAFYKNRYTPKVYPVSASIIIREMQETSGAELLYKNALIDPYRNYLNEPYIIRSYPLIEKVVKDQNYNISFFQEGYVLTSEASGFIPVRAQLCDPSESRSASYIFILKDENRYSLQKFTKDKRMESQEFNLNDSISFDGLHLCITQFTGRKWKPFINVPFLLQIQTVKSVAASYVGRLQVEWAEQGAGVINLGLTGTNPVRDIDFLTNLIVAYQERDLNHKNEAAVRTIDFIKNQLVTTRDSLRTVEFQLERFGNEGRIEDMSDGAKRLYERLEPLEVQKAELLMRKNYFDYLDGYLLAHGNKLDQVILPSSIGVDDPVLSSFLTKMVDLQLELKLYVDPERIKNPLVQTKTERINEIKGEVVEAIKTLRSTDKIKADFISKQTAELEKQLSLIPESERQLISVKRNYSLLENLYVFLMQKLSEAGISKASNTSDILNVNPAMVGSAISPKPTQNLTVAALTGLVVPLIIFILFEMLNNKVQSKEDIDKMSSIPFIGGVGHNVSETNLTVKERPKSGVAESFRALRSNLNYFTGNKTKQVFMVSSSISGEGKTFTTINLATVFALSGKSVLIVGADMRRPKIFQDFDRNNNSGLSTFLSGVSNFSEIVQQTDIENLSIVSGGPVPPNPSELLLTDRFEEFIKSALTAFDFVIIDTPPLALVTDAFVISKFVDHTIFVLRQNYSPKEFIRSIDEYYRSGKLKNLSLMLNDIYKSGLGYGYGQGYSYNYGYSYGYGYGSRKNGHHGYYEE